ncbi:MAG: flagellar protein FlaG [Gammaproteobacteria bacterium]|nr:flagellar protein FlaG [Gammaproteobacteria bacterium]MBU1415463.1 flagellar protein FlaG [Gammaproteobacteria bacterium]
MIIQTAFNPMPASAPEPRGMASGETKMVVAKPAPPSADPPPAEKPAAAPSAPELAAAVDSINRSLEPESRNLKFSIDDHTDRVIVKVVDKETGETLRQIPPEEVLAIAESIKDYQKGLILSQKA